MSRATDLMGSFESIYHDFGIRELQEELEEAEMEEEKELGESIWNETKTVTFTDIEGRRVVRCGNFNQLLIHFTDAEGGQNSAAEFADTFMVTLQTFASPFQLVGKLCERYRVPACPTGCDPEDYRLYFKDPVQLRVIKVLKKWVTTRYEQDLANREKLREQLGDFLTDVVAHEHPGAAKNLHDAISAAEDRHRLETMRGSVATLDFAGFGCYGGFGGFDDSPYDKPGQFQFDPRELAAQMTLIDSKHFTAIRLSELVGQAWAKNRKKAPHVIRSIAHCTKVTNWVIASILSEETPKGRARVITNMTSLLSALKTFRNFNGIMGVLSGLNSSPVARLKVTQRELNPRVVKIHEAFCEMMRSAGSFKTYRDTVRSTDEAAVPFLGITLSDLTFMEDGNPDFTEGMINWQKRTVMSKILTELTEQQQRCYYEIEQTELASTFLCAITETAKDHQEFYELSLALEPRSLGD